MAKRYASPADEIRQMLSVIAAHALLAAEMGHAQIAEELDMAVQRIRAVVGPALADRIMWIGCRAQIQQDGQVLGCVLPVDHHPDEHEYPPPKPIVVTPGHTPAGRLNGLTGPVRIAFPSGNARPHDPQACRSPAGCKCRCAGCSGDHT